MSKRVVLSDVEKVDLPEIPVIEEVRQIRFTKDMELVTEVADPDLFMIQRAENIDEHPKIITLENIIKCMAGDMEEGGYKFITGDTLFKIVGDMEALVTWDNSNLVNALNETYNQVLQTNNNLQDEIDRSTTTDIDHDTRINNNRQDIISNTDLINAETDRAQAEENKIRQEIADYKAEQAIRDENQDKALQAETDRAEEQEAAIRQEMADKFEEQAAKDLAQDNALKKEREDRQTEDTLIRKEIADNKTEQSAKDLEQDNALKKEIQDRKDADDAILEGIARDKVTQAAKDKAQDDALAAEVTRAKGQEAAIRSEMAEEKRLQGIKDAAQDKALADEVTRAKAKENQIQANLDAEIARATQEEQDIYANLGDEITRAVTREDEIERKFTEWDNNQDNRLELLESLTHEQNTDTGTDKVSFQLAMKNSGPRIKSESGGLSARNAADSAYVNFRAKDVTVDGDLIVKGQQSIIQSQTVEVADNTLLLNKGEVGPGVTKGFAGIEIDRGTEENFFFGFNESDDMFKIGKEGSMMDVALRDTVADMNDGMFVSWNATRKVLETTNTLPATHKITFKGNSTSIDYAIRNHADQFILENPAVSTQNVSLRFVNNRATFDTGTTHFHFLKAVFVPGYIASANSKLGIGIGNNTTEIVVIDASKITSTKPIHATTFYRSSDSSEVLYKADIVNDVTTGGATNVLSAEQGKLLAQGITQVEGSYLPLSGGTITGDLTANKGILIAADEAIKFPLLLSDTIYNCDALASINEVLTIGTSWKKILVGGSNTTITYQAKELITGLSTNIGRTDRRFGKVYATNGDFSWDITAGGIESTGNLTTKNSFYIKEGAIIFGDDVNSSPSIIKSDNFFKIKKGDMYGIQAGKLLLSDTDSTAEQDKVPANGIYSKGAVISSAGFSSAVKVTDLIMAKTGNDVLNISSFSNGTANTPGSHAISGEQVNDGIALTYFWTTDFAVQLAIDIDGSGMAYRKYTPSTGVAADWKFLANTNWVNAKINTVASNYLPLKGGTMTGNIYLNNDVALVSKTTSGTNYNLVSIDRSNHVVVGTSGCITYIISNENDLYHYRNSTKYRLWDTYNLSQPATLNTGQTFTGIKTFNSRVVLNNDIPIVGLLADGSDFRNLLWMSTSNNPCFGSASAQPVIVSNATDIIHRRANTNYNIWDTYNLPRPVQTADLANYLPLSGGTMTGTIRTNSAIILSPSSVSRLNGINVNDEGLDIDRSLLAYAKDYSKGPATIVATMKDLTLIRSNNSDLLHGKANAEGTAITSYKIWDASNLTKPVNYNDGGTAGNVINIYQRKLGVNGAYWTFLGLTNEATTGVYAPTAAGIAGQILQSTGGVPAWVNASSILGEYLPLSGGVITSSTATPLTINGTGSASDIGIAVKRANVNKAYFGHNSNLGAFMYSYTRDKYLYISDTADEVIFGKSGSSKRLAFIDDIPSVSGYLTKSVADATYLPIGGKGFLSIDSNGKPIMSNNQGYSAKQANGTVKEILWIGSNDNLNIGYSITHDAKIVTAGTLVTYGGLNYLYNRYSSPTFLSCVNINHNTSSTGGWARSFNIINQEEVIQVTYGGYGSSGTPNYAYIGVGTGVSYNSVNNLRVYVDKVTFNSKQLATTDQIPSLSGYATQEWANTQFINALAGENYVNITLPRAAQSSAGAKKYLEWWDSTPGWYNFKLGRVEAQGVLMSTNNGNTVTIGSQNDKYCHIQNSANIPFHFNNNVFVKGNLYMGASYDKLVATQEWVTSQGFLKTDKDTHYTTMFNVGVATTKADAVATNPYFKLFDDSTLRKQIRINGAGATTVTSDASGNITITSTDTNTVYSLPNATASVLGGVKVGSNITVSSGTISLTKANVTAALGYTPPTTNTTYAQATSSALGLVKIGYAESGKNYPVELNSSGQMYVNVPWSDTNTTYSIATASTAGLVKPISVITKPTLQGATTTSGRYYSVQMSSDGNMFVNVPWSDTNTTYAQATASTLGLVKIGATNLSSKNYAVQLNSSGQMYVAVPWTDTNTTYSLASTSANGLLRQLNGSTSSFLRGDGTWATPPNTTYSVATTSANGLMSSADKTKVNNAVISTSTTKVLKIEVVDEIPTTQTTGTLYLKLE